MKTPSITSLRLPALLGSSLPLVWILFLILRKPTEMELWMLVPLIVIPTGGAIGGSLFYLLGFQWFTKGKIKLIAISIGLLLYCLCLWICAVLAFNATGLWD
ncbi:MAG: hypothetical protein NBV57_03590 [Algoriphagus sp.]|nr:hypothetical protein [Algoriphagus sp.]